MLSRCIIPLIHELYIYILGGPFLDLVVDGLIQVGIGGSLGLLGVVEDVTAVLPLVPCYVPQLVDQGSCPLFA